jgi:hypothetical protein
MPLVRKYLSWAVAGWLALQIAALIASPMMLHAATLSADEGVCDCPGSAPGQMCPMHRNGGDRHHDDDAAARCGMRSALLPSDVALLVIVATGALPQASILHYLSDRSETVTVLPHLLTSRFVPPDAPPPRS